jgi:hypothetical protein
MTNTKQQQEFLAKLNKAADARQAAADAIAHRYGYTNGNAAYRGMGKAFIALVKQQAPSINKAMKA